MDIGPYYVPKGTQVVYSSCAIHLNPEYWEDPMTFKPERWLHEGESKVLKWLPFGAGNMPQ